MVELNLDQFNSIISEYEKYLLDSIETINELNTPDRNQFVLGILFGIDEVIKKLNQCINQKI